MFYSFFHRLYPSVVCYRFSHQPPYSFNGIQVGGIRRQKNQLYFMFIPFHDRFQPFSMVKSHVVQYHINLLSVKGFDRFYQETEKRDGVAVVRHIRNQFTGFRAYASENRFTLLSSLRLTYFGLPPFFRPTV